ncbi:transposase [Heliobacterium chlorum]|uniref:Transposase n=1 Tax=Heliobacterium chlorum TaxID=2698 RepID=A0ABR7T8Q8_HELCL|nr:transposase [Heliobacterium chlorum]
MTRLCEYQQIRSGIHPRASVWLQEVLHVNGYVAYNWIGDVMLVSCLVHTWRMFDEALKHCQTRSTENIVYYEL